MSLLPPSQQAEFDALLPGSSSTEGASRRVALKFVAGLGYAAAAAPLMAQAAITTSTNGLQAGPVVINSNGFAMPAYRAAPEGKTNLPVVLVVHEIFGVHEYIADTCRRLAQAGYMAIAPDLFKRQGDVSQYSEISQIMSQVTSKVPDAQVMSDLDACVQWAQNNGGDKNRMAITGFCWGGRITWLYAAQGPVKAGVAWYGRLVGASTDLTPKQPVDLTPILKAPVLGLYGGADTGIPVASVEQMRTALAQGSSQAKASTIHLYPEAGHAFHADYRASYRAEAAQDGWKRALAWFKENGV